MSMEELDSGLIGKKVEHARYGKGIVVAVNFYESLVEIGEELNDPFAFWARCENVNVLEAA